jgi:hypothetical protein
MMQPYCKQEVAEQPLFYLHLVTYVCASSSSVILLSVLSHLTPCSQLQRWQLFDTLDIMLSKFCALEYVLIRGEILTGMGH